MEKPTVVGGCEVERAYGVDAYFGIEMCVLRQLVEGFGTEEPVGHTLDDKVVVIAPAEADIPLPGNELVVPPAFDGKHDVHGFEDGALAAVAALDEFSNISVAETEMEVEMPGMPSHLQGSGELLQVERGEVTPEVAVFEREALTYGCG